MNSEPDQKSCGEFLREGGSLEQNETQNRNDLEVFEEPQKSDQNLPKKDTKIEKNVKAFGNDLKRVFSSKIRGVPKRMKSRKSKGSNKNRNICNKDDISLSPINKLPRIPKEVFRVLELLRHENFLTYVERYYNPKL
ncbi:uncharacterized protein LOC112494892 isoform X2 [Cephus cinctus]|uniref:Uncharacterized protein LOC112494892 isoform X2 n=1 Tax=Cephus cinctus TaxID=211228 RepID=A0AAJ7RNV3_CEPCN|nr:uncharacterized protein LOC112494892 isoform X2 [Cephus cinctus]